MTGYQASQGCNTAGELVDSKIHTNASGCKKGDDVVVHISGDAQLEISHLIQPKSCFSNTSVCTTQHRCVPLCFAHTNESSGNLSLIFNLLVTMNIFCGKNQWRSCRTTRGLKFEGFLLILRKGVIHLTQTASEQFQS